MAEDINKLISELKKLQKEYTALTNKKAPLFDTSEVENVKNAIETISTSIEKAKEEALRLESGFNGVYGEIQGILSELSSTESAANKVTKAFRGVSNITRDLRNDQNDIYKLTLKDLKKRQEKLRDLNEEVKYQAGLVEQRYKGEKAEQTGLLYGKDNKILNEGALKMRAASLGITVRQLKNDAAILAGKKEEFSVLQAVDKELKDRIKKEEQINELMGLGGAAVEAVGSALDKLGMSSLKNALGLNEVQDEMRSIAEKRLEKIKDGLKEGQKATLGFGDKMKVLKGGIKEAGKQLIQNLKDPLVIASFLVNQLMDAFKLIDGLSGDMAKNFAISNSEAVKLVGNNNRIATLSGNAALNTKNITEAQASLNAEFGTSVVFSDKLSSDFALIQKRLKLSAETMDKLTMLTMANNGDMMDQLKTIQGVTLELNNQEGISLNQRDIQEGLKELSASQLIANKMNTRELSNQVFQAKLLGVSQSQLESISSNLLNFSSSIEAEMQAELLTGKQLNLERARAAALTGDHATLAQELRREMEGLTDEQKKNPIIMNQFAAALGMSREELAKAMVEQEKLNFLRDQGFKSMSEAQEAYNKAVKEGNLDEVKRLELIEQGVGNQLKSANLQERFNDVMAKFTDMFVNIAEKMMPLIEDLASLIEKLIPYMGMIAGGVIGGLTGGPIGALVGLTGGLLYDMKRNNEAEDSMVSPPSTQMPALATGGIVTKPTTALIGEGGEPEAVVPLSKAQNMGFGGSDEIKQTNTLLKELIVAVKQGGDVYIDGAKAGKSLALATSRMG